MSKWNDWWLKLHKDLIGKLTHPKGGVGIVKEVGSFYSVEEERMENVGKLEAAGKAAMAKYPPKKNEKGEVVQTYCNFGLWDVAESVGCTVLRGKTANEIIAFAHANPEEFVIDTPERAAAHAKKGGLAFAGLEGDDVTGDGIPDTSGHVAAVAPREMVDSGSRGCKVPVLMNVGKTNDFLAESQCFSVKKPRPTYFLRGIV